MDVSVSQLNDWFYFGITHDDIKPNENSNVQVSFGISMFFLGLALLSIGVTSSTGVRLEIFQLENLFVKSNQLPQLTSKQVGYETGLVESHNFQCTMLKKN